MRGNPLLQLEVAQFQPVGGERLADRAFQVGARLADRHAQHQRHRGPPGIDADAHARARLREGHGCFREADLAEELLDLVRSHASIVASANLWEPPRRRSLSPACRLPHRQPLAGQARRSLIQAGAWSLALGNPLTHLSTPAAASRGASTGLSSRWSMRSPASRSQCCRK